MQQLMMFQETREDKLEREMMKLRDQQDRIRKSQFAKISELEKMYFETREELEGLKSIINRSGVAV
jgi:hypothetical protein